MGTQTDRPLIVSFATNDEYKHYGERLIEQCRSVDMDCRVDFLDPWIKGGMRKRETCLYRAEWMLSLDTDRPMVWFDADGDILEAFDIPDGPLGFVKNPWDNHLPLSAAMFMVRNKDFLHDWKNRCEQYQRGELGSHYRLCEAAKHYDYADMTPYVAGKIVMRGAKGKQEKRL